MFLSWDRFDKFGKFGRVGKFGKFANIGRFGRFASVGRLGKLASVGRLGRLGKYGKFGKLFANAFGNSWKFGMLNEGNVGRDGRFEKFGISRLDMLKSFMCGILKPSKFSNPASGDWSASPGLSSVDDVVSEAEDEEGEEDEE